MKKEKCILGPEEVQAEKDFIVNVLGINLFDSEERDDRLGFQYNGKSTDGYRYLAMKYWPEIFENTDELIEVHHISGDRSDNRVCNLVPVTKSQHVKLHSMFFNNYKIMLKNNTKKRAAAGGKVGGKHACDQSQKEFLSELYSGKSRYKDEFGKWHWEL